MPSYYLNNISGNDSNLGTYNSPWRTFSKVQTSSMNGDIIVLEPTGVPYDYTIVDKAVSILGRDVRFCEMRLQTATNTPLFCNESNFLKNIKFTFSGNWPGVSLHLGASMQNCIVQLGGVASSFGILSKGNFSARNCLFIGNSLNSFFVLENNKTMSLYNCVVFYAGYSGGGNNTFPITNTSTSGSVLIVKNCIFYGYQTAGFLPQVYNESGIVPTIQSANNCFFNFHNIAGSPFPPSSYITSDPQFLRIGQPPHSTLNTNIYSLKLSSPCRFSGSLE